MSKTTKKILHSNSRTINATCYVLSARHRSGQLLIEMLVALGILTVGFLGVTTLLAKALSLNRVVSDNYTATYLASEGMEITKNILDGNVIQGAGWNAGFHDGDFEVDFGSTTLTPTQDRYLTYNTVSNQYGYGFTLGTLFKRTIHVSLPPSDANEIIVNSRVDWATRGGGSNSLNLEDHFFNWR